MNTKSRVLYGGVTLLFSVSMVLGGVAEIAGPKQAVANMMQLGYPLYILPFLGVAKLLGVAAIVTGRYPRLKEWAYAGFTFDLLGAAYSHLSVGQGRAAVAPLLILLIGAASYILWRRQGGGESTADKARQDRHTLNVERVEAR